MLLVFFLSTFLIRVKTEKGHENWEGHRKRAGDFYEISIHIFVEPQEDIGSNLLKDEQGITISRLVICNHALV